MPIAYDQSVLDRVFTLELARVAESAAVAAARWRGRGNEKAADQAAVDAMRTGLNNLHIKGRVVIGEGERDEAPMLYIGEEVGRGDVLFAATGVTDGAMLSGVRFTKQFIQTETIVMRSSTGTVREIKARHQDFSKFS
jgi:fructose-1,6-bisphosphatase/sedoheptulose 1,7-bisphosphatase-like protein